MSDSPPTTSTRPRSAADRAARDDAIGRAALAGEPTAVLAERYGLTARQVRRIVKAWTPDETAPVAPTSIEDFDVDALLREALDAHRVGLRTCRVLLLTGAPNAQIGAARTLGPLTGGMYELMRALGLVLSPDAVYARRKDDEVRRFVGGLLDVLEARGLDYPEIAAEIAQAADRAKHAPTWTVAA